MREGLFCRLVTTQYGKTEWLLTGDDRLPMKKVPTGMSSKKVSGLKSTLWKIICGMQKIIHCCMQFVSNLTGLSLRF